MPRFVFRFSLYNRLLIVACLAAFFCFQARPALAQHAVGGHLGGGAHFSGGVHFATGSRVAAPHVAVPPPGRAAVGPFSGGARPLGLGAPGFRLRPRPIHPRPVLPIIPFPIFFGGPFFGYWPGYGFNSVWWPSCYPYWGWGFGCNATPYVSYFGYGFGGNISPYVSPYIAPPEYVPPASYYGGEDSRERPRLYFQNGTIYSVTDYWLVNGQIHFTTLEEGGTKSVEHVIPFEDLDLQQTIDVNTRMGFRFVLRNAPIEHYLRDGNQGHPPADKAPPQEN